MALPFQGGWIAQVLVDHSTEGSKSDGKTETEGSGLRSGLEKDL
jgi:hypothetical protein